MSPPKLSLLFALALIALIGCSNASTSETPLPFTLGPAVRAQCEGEGIPAAYCQPLNEAITQMLAESRDKDWADEMEQRIAEAMHLDGKHWAEIRSLECRRTLCALEYAARIDAAPAENTEGFDELLQSLESVSGGIGYELPKADGEARVVGVMVWKRKQEVS
jgi:hypothetical protein